MWKPPIHFITIHYAWILLCIMMAFVILYPYGNLEAIDAFFFGCSSSTESGLNPVDVNDLKTYQQVYIYIIPTITNMMFINAMVVPMRLYWFRQRLKKAVENRSIRRAEEERAHSNAQEKMDSEAVADNDKQQVGIVPAEAQPASLPEPRGLSDTQLDDAGSSKPSLPQPRRTTTITFDDNIGGEKALRIPSPREADSGKPIIELDLSKQTVQENGDEDVTKPIQRSISRQSLRSSFQADGAVLSAARSIERAASSAFVLGDSRPHARPGSRARSESATRLSNLPSLSRHVTLGRNSTFHNMTERDREILGGIEYRALKVLVRFVFGYFFGLHFLGIICLLPWIHNAPSKYTDYLAESGVGRTWWAFYSAQTMSNNLGFTLTPDSMASFKDATWPMLVMTFLAFAGHTCYPICLRLCIWIASKLVRKGSPTMEPLQFLLHHPRRCYTLLFPSRPTWILLGIVFILNFVDVLLIIVLDLNNPAVNDLPLGPRILSALFQAASARHTGTSTLNLADVSPAVQFSLLTMMYIAIFPIAISIRASNTYEEQTVGIWGSEGRLDESNSKSYVLVHIRNQLTFDLWYIFLGSFLVCAAETKRIMDKAEPAFSVFAILFEVTSAYGNVGLSLGGPAGSTSMSGHYTTFGKVVICIMMIRGRHRGLPYSLDRAITLPIDLVDGVSPTDCYSDAPAAEATLPPNKESHST